MEDKRRVLIIAPCLAMGGMERASVNVANALCEQGIDVIFISLFKKEHFFKLHEHIVLEEPVGFNIKKLSMLKSIIWLRRCIKKHNPDSVLVFNKFYGAISAFSMIGISTPFFISERSSPLFVWKQPFKFINRLGYFLRPPQGVMAQTSIAAQYQQKYYKKAKIKVIPNVLREVVLYPEIERQQVVLAVGRLGDHLKGFDLLIESFALVKNKQWELHIAGGDEDGADLKAQAKRLGVFDRIRFLGKVQDIDKAYAKAGIYVIPSRSEGFPNALAEAMAAGCACVTFDFIAGPRDIIEDGVSGIIVENGNIQKMAETIDWLIEHPEKRIQLGKEAMNLRKRLHKEVITNEIKQFLNA